MRSRLVFKLGLGLGLFRMMNGVEAVSRGRRLKVRALFPSITIGVRDRDRVSKHTRHDAKGRFRLRGQRDRGSNW